jgi:hypothetical protein
MKTTLMTLFGLVLVLYLSFSVLLYATQHRLLYFPIAALAATPAQIGLEYEEIFLTAADGTRLAAWFVPAKDALGVILFCHGNAGNISHRLDSLEIFHSLGLSTLIFDYRGYGASEGDPTERGTYEDAEAAWHFLVRDRGIPAGEIILFGRSLGGAVAAWLAARESPQALILESSFTSVPDLASSLYPFFPVRLLSRYRYDTRKELQQIRCPLLVVHSPQDEIIPFSHGKALYESAPSPKKFLEIAGDHNTGFLRSKAEYTRGLAEFIRDL